MRTDGGAAGAGPERELVYDWNRVADGYVPARRVEVCDETLRDGLQSPSVIDPPIQSKIRLVHLMESLGIESADLGLPGAGQRQIEHVSALCKEIASARLKIRPKCAARTMVCDIEPIARIADAVGMPVEAGLFIMSSPIRQYTEGWTMDDILRQTEEAVTYAVRRGLPTLFVTEDTTRAHPDDLRRMYRTAIECGASRICVCDTVGHSTPEGTAHLIRFVRELVQDSGEGVGVDWHGHRDRGLSVENSIAAVRAGASRIHATAIGIGERCGNTPMEVFLVNMKLLGWIDRDLRQLTEYCALASEACGVPIPTNYPIVGSDAFQTATGIHAAAVIKAFRKGDTWLADRVYSGVPAADFGQRQQIRVGPMSGRSNVVWWLEQNGYEPTEEAIERILEAAKRSTRLLVDAEIRGLVEGP
jgi:2-isopropylmalate synthase